MVDGIKKDWIEAHLPVNQPEDIASAVAGLCLACPGTDPIWYDEKEAEAVHERHSMGGMKWDETRRRGVNGRAIFVMGGKCFDIEEGLDKTEQLWLGKSVSGSLKKGQENLGNGTHWIK